MRAIAAIVAACVCIAGCERKSQVTTAVSVSVIDDAQRTVPLAAPATRVVSLMPTVTDLIVAMNRADVLIARTDYDTDPRIATLPSVGGGLTPSVEWLVSRKPDLVVSWPDNGSRSIVTRLGAVDIPVYAARTESIDDAMRTIRNLGVMLGSERAADSLHSALQSAFDSIRTSVAQLEPVSVAYVLSVDPPTIAGPRTFIDELITIAGGRNVFADIAQSWPQINLEEVIRRDPDVIVLARESADDPELLLSRLPGWRDMRAVKAHRVFRVSPDYFNRSGPLMPRAARELAQFFAKAR